MRYQFVTMMLVSQWGFIVMVKLRLMELRLRSWKLKIKIVEFKNYNFCQNFRSLNWLFWVSKQSSHSYSILKTVCFIPINVLKLWRVISLRLNIRFTLHKALWLMLGFHKVLKIWSHHLENNKSLSLWYFRADWAAEASLQCIGISSSIVLAIFFIGVLSLSIDSLLQIY